MTFGTTSLPSVPIMEVSPNVLLQPPLSRCGRGPGLILLRAAGHADCQENNHSLDPEPLQKWAEESFAVAQITLDSESSKSEASVSDLVRTAEEALRSLAECENDKLGLLVYGSQADYAPNFGDVLHNIISGQFAAAVYFDVWNTPNIPAVLHLAAPQLEGPTSDTLKVYSYPEASSSFIIPGHADFNISSAGVAHTRSLAFIKNHLGGPYFDLEKIWDEHTYYEFGDRSVEKTMATMVQEPYVNHVPTLTGGIGRERLSKFYLNHFIFNNPDDTKLELISRTVGVDRVVDEFIFCLTHNKVVDWLLPGIPPTGKPLRIPFTSVVNIRGDRLYHEHIAWDQATVLIQLGLLPEYLPFPYPLSDGRVPRPGKRFEYRVPAAGAETADKLQNEHLVPSNGLLAFEVREVDER
ncbi:carboxymethylenebutenolidase [Aspergillus aurantiobrunneus]